MTGSKRSPFERGPPPGHCIYCCSITPPLTKEHIIPEGLGGKQFIPEASCAACCKITAKFEAEVLRSPMIWPLRSHLGVKGKRKAVMRQELHRRTITGKLIVEETDVSNIPLKAYIPYWLERPRLILGETYNPNPSRPYKLLTYIDKKANSNAQFVFGYGSQDALIPLRSFARMIAKITYCQAIAVLGKRLFTPFLLPIILGYTRDWEYFIGNIPTGINPREAGGNNLGLKLALAEPDPFILAYFYMMAFDKPVPLYEVAVGLATDADAVHRKLQQSLDRASGNNV